MPGSPRARQHRAGSPLPRHLLRHDGWQRRGGRSAHLACVPAWLGAAPRPGRRPASGREGKAGCCVNLAPLPAALERRIPPQKESTPTPRVTHLPAPLPRTHTALTLHGQRHAAGCQPRTGQGASPGPLPPEEIPSAGRTGTLCRGHPLPAAGIASPPHAPAPCAEASDRLSRSRRPKAGRWVPGAHCWPWPARPSREGACAWRERGCHRRAGLGAACHGLPGQPWSRPPNLQTHVPLRRPRGPTGDVDSRDPGRGLRGGPC